AGTRAPATQMPDRAAPPPRTMPQTSHPADAVSQPVQTAARVLAARPDVVQEPASQTIGQHLPEPEQEATQRHIQPESAMRAAAFPEPQSPLPEPRTATPQAEQTLLRRRPAHHEARTESLPEEKTTLQPTGSAPDPEPKSTDPSTLDPATVVAAAAPISQNHVTTDTPAKAEGGSVMPEAANGLDNKTRAVRGIQHPDRDDYYQEPVVAWLVVIGGPGLGAFRPIYEGNNAIGRAQSQRIAIDFGDDSISAEEQAYIRYDSADRTFLFVPNLAKTNVVSLNETKPTTAVRLSPMDVITVGQTQLVFVPFCGPEFDWSELKDIHTPGHG
ncbi:MAG: hypothetical protein ACR2O4_17900, partial [Hyphomicrobiaceae bacterium]